MKVTKSKLKQIIKEELESAIRDDVIDDDELENILDEPILEGMMMEIDPAGVASSMSSIEQGMYIGLGIILAYTSLNAAGVAVAFASELLDTFASGRKRRKYQQAAMKLQEAEENILDRLISDPEFVKILEEYSDLAAYLPKQRGKRSKELQAKRKRLKNLAASLREEVKKKAMEIQRETGAWQPSPHLGKVQSRYKSQKRKEEI